MKQARKFDSIDEHSHATWPTGVQAAALFELTDCSVKDLIAVHVLDYAIFKVLQVTSISDLPFTVLDLTVNGEFHPLISIANLTERFVALQMPKMMSKGSSFNAILQAPATAGLRPGCCYPKEPASVLVLTDRGSFTFRMREIVRAES